MKLKPFDLEAAKAGAKVVMRDGTPVRIICFDRKDKYSVVALAEDDKGSEVVNTYSSNGIFFLRHESPEDLFMAPVAMTNFAPIFLTSQGRELGIIYDSREEAEEDGKESGETYTIAEITWEE